VWLRLWSGSRTRKYRASRDFLTARCQDQWTARTLWAAKAAREDEANFAPAPAGRAYQAWGEFGGRRVLLGTVHPKGDGSDLLIAEGPHLKSPPTALKVTLEPVGTPLAPNGPTVIAWLSR